MLVRGEGDKRARVCSSTQLDLVPTTTRSEMIVSFNGVFTSHTIFHSPSNEVVISGTGIATKQLASWTSIKNPYVKCRYNNEDDDSYS